MEKASHGYQEERHLIDGSSPRCNRMAPSVKCLKQNKNKRKQNKLINNWHGKRLHGEKRRVPLLRLYLLFSSFPSRLSHTDTHAYTHAYVQRETEGREGGRETERERERSTPLPPQHTHTHTHTHTWMHLHRVRDGHNKGSTQTKEERRDGQVH